MTATASPPRPTVWSVGAPRLLAGLDRYGALDLATHQAVHGPMRHPDLGKLIELCDAVALTGRGGAGFPFAGKLRALRRGERPVVVVNGAESEPGSAKDRTLLSRAPHLVLDGAAVVADAISAREVVVAVHDARVAEALRRAITERGDRVRVEQAGGGFVGGEARALMHGLGGRSPVPPGRRVHGTDRGLRGAPTITSNAETFAQLAVLLRLGVAGYRSTGASTEPGSTLITIGGAVEAPGVVEIPLGTPLGIVLAAAGAPAPHAVVVGGYHGSWHAPLPGIAMSRHGLAAAGGTFGAGVLLVLDGSSCELGELARVTGWLAAQSTRRCGPCRFGLPALAADVEAIARGDARGVEAALRHSRVVNGRGACAHPDGAARFVGSALHVLHQETQRHLYGGGCGRPVRGLLPIVGTP